MEKKYKQKTNEERNNKINDVKTAFVIFRSMEGRQRALYAYDKTRLNICSDLKRRILMCCCGQYNWETLFMGKYDITIKPAPTTDHIHWENLGVHEFLKVILKFLSLLISFAIICAATYATIWFTYKNEEISQRNSINTSQASRQVTLEEAMEDSAKTGTEK